MPAPFGARRSRLQESTRPEEWKAGAVASGMPPAAADFTLGMYRAARRGEFAVTHPALADLLGREPRSARAVLADLVAA